MNKKGMTLVEIIVAISLISVVMIFLFQVLITVINGNKRNNTKSKTLIKVSGVNHAIFKNDKKDMIINDIKLFLQNKIKNSQNIIEK